MNNFKYIFADAPTFSFTSPIFYILLALAIIFLAAFIVGIILSANSNNETDSRFSMKTSNLNVRIFVYDYSKDSFYSFDRMNLKNAKKFTKDQFYSQFARIDQYLVENWLHNIALNNKHPNYLQADIVIGKSKHMMSSMLQLTSVDRQKAIIHFESHLLPYFYSINEINAKRKGSRLNRSIVLTNGEEAQNFINSASPDSLIGCYYFKLYSMKEGTVEKNEYQKLTSVNNKILFSLSRFLNRKGRKMIRISPTEEVIIDLHSVSKISAMTFAFTIQNSVQQIINLYSTEKDNYRIAVGISNSSCSGRNYSLAKEQSGKMADAIMKGLTNEKILFYDESFFTNYQINKIQKEEIRMVIKNNTIRNYFSPTLNITDGKQSFYFLKVLPYGTSVSGFNEVLSIAKNMKNGCSFLFKGIQQKCERIVKSRKDRVSIALHIPYQTINDAVKSLPMTSESNIDWILIFDETDLLTCDDDHNVVSQNLNNLRKKNYQTGLIVRNPNSALRSKVLKNFNYFFIPPSFVHSTNGRDNYRSRNDLRNIQLTYGPYKAKMVYYGLRDFDDIELGVYYDGQIFDCDALSLPSSHLEIVDEKIVDEIMEKTKNLHSTKNNILSTMTTNETNVF